MKRGFRIITAATTVALAAATTGCYGQFALTRSIYDWNGRATPNKFANSALTWALLIIPVYEIAGVVDFLVLNTIEFWSGKNPVLSQKDGSLLVERDGHQLRYQQVGNVVKVERDGVPAYQYHRQDDKVIVRDTEGRVLKVLAASDPAAAKL